MPRTSVSRLPSDAEPALAYAFQWNSSLSISCNHSFTNKVWMPDLERITHPPALSLFFPWALVLSLGHGSVFLNPLELHPCCCCSVTQSCPTLWPPGTEACQASLPFTISQSLLKLMSIELVMPSNHLIFCVPCSSCLQSFPATGSFLMSQFFASGAKALALEHQSFQWIFRIAFLYDWLLWIDGTLLVK